MPTPSPTTTGLNFVSQTVAEFYKVQPDRYVQSDLVDEIIEHIETTMPEAWADFINLTKINHINALLRNHLHASRRRSHITKLNEMAQARGDSKAATGNIGDARYGTRGSIFATVRCMTKAEVLNKIRQLDSMEQGIQRRRHWFEHIAEQLVSDDQRVEEVWTDDALNDSWQAIQD